MKKYIGIFLILIVSTVGVYIQQTNASNVDLKDIEFQKVNGKVVVTKVKGEKVQVGEKNGKKYIKAPGVIFGDDELTIDGKKVGVNVDDDSVEISELGNSLAKFDMNEKGDIILTSKEFGTVNITNGENITFDSKEFGKIKAGKDSVGIDSEEFGSISANQNGEVKFNSKEFGNTEITKDGIKSDIFGNIKLPKDDKKEVEEDIDNMKLDMDMKMDF